MSNRNQGKTISFFTAGVITTVSIALVLILLGLTSLVALTSSGLASVIKENLSFTIEIASDASESTVAKIQKELDENEYIKSAVYISKEEIRKDLINKLGLDPTDVLGYNPALSYFEVFVKSEYVNPEGMAKVKESLRGKTMIQNIIYSDEDVSMANEKLSIIGTILLGLTVILVAISFILIRSIIQLNIYSKRFLINTMQLVGATNSFIRKPFITKMIANGVIAAILASFAVTGVAYYVTQVFPEVITIITSKELIIVYVVIFLSGISISIIATTSAVNRYLRMTTNKLYRV